MINNGQDADARNLNGAFTSTTADNVCSGKQGYNREDSGTPISDIQKTVNKLMSVVGITEISEAINDYESKNYITTEDDRKEALGKLDAALKALSNVVAAMASPTYREKTSTVNANGTLLLDNFVGLHRLYISGNAAAVSLNVAPFGISFNDIPDGSSIELIGVDNANTVTLVATDADWGYLGDRGDIVFSKGTVLRLSFNKTLKRFFGA